MTSKSTTKPLHVTPLVAAAFALLVVLPGCDRDEKPPPPPKPVIALKVLDASGLAERTFPGRARAAREVNRSFRVSGPLITLDVNVGDEVQEGDVLARIDPNDFEARVDNLEGELERARAAAVLGEREYERGREIDAKGTGLISKSELDKRLAARNRARAQVRALTASLKLAKDKLSYTTLAAPFDGVVVETYVENFETVVAKQPILRMLDSSAIEMDVSVPENLISLAPYVEDITVVFDAFPEVEVSATITKIGQEATQATRTYPVTLLMNQPEGIEILPGMAGHATIVSRPPEDSELVGIQIPATAVFTGEDRRQNFVWVVDESTQTISRREVQIKQLARLGVLVQSGLQSGEWIVTKGVHTLKEGQEVRILDDAKRAKAS